ncbi:MAG: hypothetical protein ACK42C_07950 [Aquificaceae bacterium]
MREKKLEMFKEKYQQDWERFRSELPTEKAEELFYKWALAKERLKKAKEKALAVSERERKREARALIILAKILIREMPSKVSAILNEFPHEFIQKEGRQEVDYSVYVRRLLPQERF